MMQNEEESFFSDNSKMIDYLKQVGKLKFIKWLPKWIKNWFLKQEEDWGMIMESGGAKYFLPNYCDFYTVGSLASRYYGFAVPKGN